MMKPAASPRRPGRPSLSDDQLLDVALDLFLEHGFEGTSIDAIAAAAGMAKRTLYARHDDKVTLFKAALTRAIERWIVPVERLRAAECEALEETLINIGQILLANILSADGLRLLRLSNAASARMPEISAYNTQIGTEPTLLYLADLFRRQLLPGSAPVEEADEAALAFLHLVIGGPASSAAWGIEFEPATRDRHIHYCVRLFLNGAAGGGPPSELAHENERLKAIIAAATVQLNAA